MKRRSIGCFLVLIAFAATGSQCPSTTVPGMTLTGVATNGKTLFNANGCVACHCATAIGGCAANAPSLVGVSTQEVDSHLRGTANHPGGKFTLTDQEIADIQAFLANPSI